MQRFFTAFLLGWMILAFYTHLETGLADNSDFSRIMTYFTSGPATLETNWPDPRTQETLWQRRFFNYWIPHWRLDFPDTQPVLRSSVLLLWYPGVWLNKLFYSNSILSLQFLALMPRLLLFATLWLLLRWVDQHADYPKLRLLTLVLPLTLLVTAHDYTIFLSSFYAETALVVYGFGFVVALLYLAKTQQWRWLAAALLLLCLLITAKASHIYLLAMVPVLVLLKGWHFRRKTIVFTLLCMVILGIVGMQFGRNANLTRYNTYNSLFYGVLPFSEQPQTHLDALGLDTATACVDTLVYTFMGGICNHIYGDQMSFANTLRVVAREPQLLPRTAIYVANNMHNTELTYLGRRAEADPFVSQWKETHQPLVRTWMQGGLRYPGGVNFYILLLGYALLFSTMWRQTTAKIGLALTLLVPLDMAVAFLGDGKQELIKHLLFANWLFDVATVFLLTTSVVWAYAVIREASHERLAQKLPISQSQHA